jgi:hypothetical protein
MSWPVCSLPEYKILKEQIKTKQWFDFYAKYDYFIGSEKSINLINKLRNGKNNIQLVEKKREKKTLR